jgi:tetratricopeptide (TPR) repeat protein
LLAGRTVLRTLDWRDDVSLFTSVIEADPDHAWAHFNLGGALVRHGMISEATGHLERTIQLNPRHTKAHFMLGSIHIDAGNWLRALAAFDATLSLDPTGYDEAIFGRAYALEALGRPAEAAIGYRAYVATAEKKPRGTSDELLSRARTRIAALENDER